MEKELKALLLSFDDEEQCECPQNFNYLDEMKRVHSIKSQIENIIRNKLRIDDQVQDASFFTELAIYKKSKNKRDYPCEDFKGTVWLCDLGIKFSSFGNMVTISSVTEGDMYSKYPIEKIIEILKNNGYIYIDSESLNESYDGINKYMDEESTWWVRYFDYI
ncbi:hypothetical protein CHF27_013220 [Romboutsia maritimum]|uniref:Uncharacterized protein n=1 Tax=Romboutsia maritimum TaxID=2020948 RepID=A0A371IPT4_9FIRM|nr:hypothetical protein [Romboutsia maritimum]RDY22486.1 hypothetical protein CHF27_013220 [Romboutsia maritimum]